MRSFKRKAHAFVLVVALGAGSTFNANSQTLWPVPDWSVSTTSPERMSSPTCKAFLDFSLHSKKFLTEGACRN